MIRARIKETCELAGTQHNGSNIRSLGTIAKSTGVRQVIGISRPSMLFGNDVIDLTPQVGVVFMDQTVFTKTIGKRLNKSSKIGRDKASHCEQCVRARALASRIRCSSFR
jgi:hypothetical protein